MSIVANAIHSGPQSMIDTLQRLAAWLMKRVRVNRLMSDVDDGVPVLLKRRRWGSSLVIWVANRLFELAHSGIWMFVWPDAWLDWEVYCAGLLYPDRTRVKLGPRRTLVVPIAAGMSLRQWLQQPEAAAGAFAAAARELRRVHQIHCSYYGDNWSHGDLHLDNFYYDAASDRATLIDFDTRHDFRLPRTQRQADDLCVMLLELGGVRAGPWRELATILVEQYGEPAILAELDRQLTIPRGLAKILWLVRTGGCSNAQAMERIQTIRSFIQHITMGSVVESAPSSGHNTAEEAENCLHNR